MRHALFILQASAATLAAPSGGGDHHDIKRRDLSPASELSTSWSYLGCIVDSVSFRTLPYASYASSSQLTGQACVRFCAAKGYPVAGTEYSRECWCGISLAMSTIADTSDCNMPCTGDASQACGGSDRLTVYQNVNSVPKVNPGVSGYKFIGCYTDSVRARALTQLSTSKVVGGCSNMTVAGCTAACASENYQYSGVEYSGECWCSNTILNGQSAVTSTPPSNGCNMPCRGNHLEYCGGSNRINVYQATSASTSTSTPSPAATNIITNGDFEQGTVPWQVAYPPVYGASNLQSAGSVSTNYAYSGTHAYEIYESGYGDNGHRSLCLQQTVYYPTTSTYTLSFFYGRQANPPPGSTTTNDAIDMQLYVDGNLITAATVCNPTLGTCTVPAINGVKAYDRYSGTLPVAQGYHEVEICAVYTTTKRGTQDFFLIDTVQSYAANK